MDNTMLYFIALGTLLILMYAIYIGCQKNTNRKRTT